MHAYIPQGAAQRLHALESLTRTELAHSLHEAVTDFAATSAAKRIIGRGVMHMVRWRRLVRAREVRRAEQQARLGLSQAVQLMHARQRAMAEVAARRRQVAEERATALRSANAALSRLKQVWQHAPALKVALKAAEAAARHRALPADYVSSAECQGRLKAARAQLHKLHGWDEQEERMELIKEHPRPSLDAAAASSSLEATSHHPSRGRTKPSTT